jgi:uncharacterized alpha-E superfamily protein
MLARLAENLFWAGRYLERTEDTARLADVTYHTLLESSREEADAWGRLLDVLYLSERLGPREREGQRVLRLLVLEPDNPNSIVATVGLARENARSVRELISTELWESINELYHALSSRDLAGDLAHQPWELFAMVRRSCLTIYGVASETMLRDDGWRFLALGRLLERAEMTSRLLQVGFAGLQDRGGSPRRRAAAPTDEEPRGPDRIDFHHWVALLKSASSFEAYRRRYRASMDPADVVEFLLLAPDLPRSVLFGLTSACHQLEALSAGAPSRAGRRLGRLAAQLQYRDVTELFELGLDELLEEVQTGIAGVADETAAEFFRHDPGGSLRAVAST